MNDKRGFWIAVGGAFLGASGFIVIQFVRSSQPGHGAQPWLIPAAMALSFVPIVLVIAFVFSVVSGWAKRAEELKAMGMFDVIAPILKSDQMVEELRRVNPTAAGRSIARALSLTANSKGIGIWSGRSSPSLEVWLPWANIEDIRPTVTRDLFERYRGVLITARWGAEQVQLPIPVAGGYPFGARIATSDAIQRLIGSVKSVRPGGFATTDVQT